MALAANRQTDRKDGAIVDRPAGVDVIYQGGLVTLNASGYAVAGQDVAGYRFGGVAYEKIDNSGGSAGDLNVRCWRTGTFSFAGTGFTLADVGKRVYVADDETVQLAQPEGGNVFCGVIVEYVSSTEVLVDIEPAVAPQRFNRVCLHGSLTAATTFAGGDVLSLLNPFGGRAVILDFVLDITTKSTGAASVDAGVAAGATTTSDTLIDGLDVNAAAGIFDNIDNKGSNGLRGVAWASNQYVTITPTASVAGLVGTYYIDCLVPTAW